jgi:hypothetical protein
MNLMKALLPSVILTLMLSAAIGVTGAPQAFLNLQEASVAGYPLYWSWTFFFFTMALFGGLVLVRARNARLNDGGAPETI